ncbi:SH3 domain-containing protein [Roseinatronobacter monicus]|uniref:SH3 domain-containing protein n=1 Tax=Roseinatronobacter monicus TaxID=393481 RepID=UPI003F309C1C
MRHIVLPALLIVLFVSGCAGGGISDRAVVKGAGAELLKLRAGPGLGYNIILGLPDGTVVSQRNCVTEVGQRWCRVALHAAPSVTGYVSADYLSQP